MTSEWCKGHKKKGHTGLEFAVFVFDENHGQVAHINRAGAWTHNMPNFYILIGRNIIISSTFLGYRLFYVRFKTDPKAIRNAFLFSQVMLTELSGSPT